MTKLRRVWRVLAQLLLGSALISRSSSGAAAPEIDEALVSARWDEVRKEAEAQAAKGGLPPEVTRFLPEEGGNALDVPTSIRLSYAAAEQHQFDLLDMFWARRPELKDDPLAQAAFSETRRWLSTDTVFAGDGPGGPPVQLASLSVRNASDVMTDVPDFSDYIWNANRGREDRDGDDDDDDGYDDD